MAGEEAPPRTGCCCNLKFLIQLITFGIWTALGVALIVVGARYRDQCAVEPYIPVYMIVMGAFSFAYWAILPLECCFPTLRRIISILVAMFVFAWFISGSVWVFRVYHITNRDCHNGMYLYVFAILLIQWILIGLGVIAALLACFCCENSIIGKICQLFTSCLEFCPCLECLRCLKCRSCFGRCLERCKCLQCCQCLMCARCLECCKCLQCLKCCPCLQSCNCLESCNCLQSCNCLENCNCLQCLKCSDCCKCLQCCDCFKSLCCCCKNIQCSSCLNCSLCARCCKCLQCCIAEL